VKSLLDGVKSGKKIGTTFFIAVKDVKGQKKLLVNLQQF
tara:strand:- start:574 stop:690 length:117 start_codon:yes stop_codon:yes gene_type:complete